ncbi:MAG: hypothetical protein MJK04_20095 [Psychrosphaera sp.]|nr:hypothetical protein [Psychrosphaera sp.]
MAEQDSDFEPQDEEKSQVKNRAQTDTENQPVHVSERTPELSTKQTPDEKKWDYPKWVDTFQNWLGNSTNNEMKNLVDFFDRSGEWWATAKELTTEEFAQKSVYLKRDLMMFYRHYQQDMAESDFFRAVKESAWKELADMTDKAQIEWQELEQDFRHQGIYKKGEWVGMGTIVCKSCHYKMEFVHPEELPACPECGESTFLREALAP